MLHLVCCENLRREFEALIAETGQPIDLRCYPPHCDRPGVTAETLQSVGLDAPERGDAWIVVGGGCLHDLAADCRARAKICCFETCFDLFIGKTLRMHLTRQGVYLLTPGWLAHWREHIAAWGFDEPTARDFFRESANKLLLLETLPDPANGPRLGEFAPFVGLPSEILPVGLDLPARWLDNAIALYRLDEDRREARGALAAASRTSADNAMAMDLVGALAVERTAEDTIDRLLELLLVLFAPSRVSFLPVIHGVPGVLASRPPLTSGEEAERDRLFSLAGTYKKNSAGDGFCLKITHGGKMLGVLAVEGVRFPEHLDRYLDTTATIARVTGLALSNAAYYAELHDTVRKLEEALENIRTLRGLLPICAGCKRIRDDSGYWNHLENYIAAHSDATFTHGLCPECVQRLYGEYDIPTPPPPAT